LAHFFLQSAVTDRRRSEPASDQLTCMGKLLRVPLFDDFDHAFLSMEYLKTSHERVSDVEARYYNPSPKKFS
jgi:hypothetical protein